MRRHVLAVIVLYKTAASEAISLRDLLRARAGIEHDELDLAIMLYDNSPAAICPSSLPEGVFYFHEGVNKGLAQPYNAALSMAHECGYDWMLTLDQDTELPKDLLRMLLNILVDVDGRPSVAAIVPQLRVGSAIASPNYFAWGGWPRFFADGYTGIPNRTVFAFNSGSLLRVSALRQVGGYSPWFWLDNSDSFLYRQLAKYGKRVFVAGILELKHNLSLKNMHDCVSPERYETMLLAESAFWDMEMNGLAGMERTARLAARMYKHWRRGDDKALRRLTFRSLLLRLFRSKKYRIERWRRDTAGRLGSALKERISTGRPKVSVCMATYNGERFIEAQLRSILEQLAHGDEVVVVDDASRDRTCALVMQLKEEFGSRFRAPQIHLIGHVQNRGIVRTFEDAVRSATGDILFLADQDDLWAPDKVEKVLAAFQARSETQIVATGLMVIDENDRPVLESPLLKNRKFTAGLLANLVHNQFQGAALAFRSSFIQHILPFPAGRLFLHDRWIGAQAILRGAEIQYIEEPLLYYRTHLGNYTRQFSRWKQVWMRLQLFGDLFRLCRHQL